MSEQIPRPGTPGPSGSAAPAAPSPVTDIATLPPLDVEGPQGPGPATPRIEALAVVATVCYGLAALASAVALAWAWWGSIHVATFRLATNLMTWTYPRPGSLKSVLLAALMMVIGGVMVAMPGLLAVNTRLGRRWVRWGALGGLAAALLAVLMNTLAWVGLPFSLAGGVLVWTPPVRRWMDRWARVRALPEHAPAAPRRVTYGRIPQHF